MDIRKSSHPATILLLGAGTMQEPAIRAAHELGYQVTAADGNRDAPAIPLADSFAQVDLKDRSGIVDLAKSIHAQGNLAAVFTAATDFSAAVAAACAACNLPSHTVDAAENATDKIRMRSCFSRAGVPSPSFYEWNSAVENQSTIIHRLERLLFGDILSNSFDPEKKARAPAMRLPLVVKPVDNMGARGCRLVRTASEIPNALMAARDASRSRRVIIEEYMDGPEYSVDALVYKETLTVTGFADRHIHFPPYFVEMGHTLPAKISALRYTALVETLAAACGSLGLSHGAVKGDLKWTDKGPMVGEVAGRLSGGYMSGWTYPAASFFDVTKAALLVALGKTPTELEAIRTPVPISQLYGKHNPAAGKVLELYHVLPTRTSAERAWISIPGTVAEVLTAFDVEKITESGKAADTEKTAGIGKTAGAGSEAAPTAFAYPHLRFVYPRAAAGDTVDFPRNNVQKAGNVIAVAPLRSTAVSTACKAASKITVVLSPRNAATDRFLSRAFTIDERDFPPDAYPSSDLTRARLAASPSIQAGASVKKALPPYLKVSLKDTDWNGLSFVEALERFDTLRPDHGVLKGGVFWNAALRAGIQGMLYVADSAPAAKTGSN